MEVILKKEDKKETNEIFEFIKTLNPEEQKAFKYVIDGFKIARAIGKGVNQLDKKKETAPEVPVQEQYQININKRRKENVLESIENGNIDFIPIYLQHFKMNINPKESLLEQDIKPELKELGAEIIMQLREKELTYVDAYVTLEYVYRNLKFMSEYTHLQEIQILKDLCILILIQLIIYYVCELFLKLIIIQKESIVIMSKRHKIEDQ